MTKGPREFQILCPPAPQASNSIPGLPSLSHYLAERAVKLPPAHDELGFLMAYALQAAQLPG